MAWYPWLTAQGEYINEEILGNKEVWLGSSLSNQIEKGIRYKYLLHNFY